jgi:hypothetical protein
MRRHVLPKDLPGAIKQLDDQELDRLQAAVLAEQKRRRRKPAESVEPRDKRRIEAAIVHLTPGKLNAVRAAFKAGVKLSQIARQFGLSQAEVRKALASDASRRTPDRGYSQWEHLEGVVVGSGAKVRLFFGPYLPGLLRLLCGERFWRPCNKEVVLLLASFDST